MKRRPIRVFYSVLSQRFFATRAWKEVRPGLVECTGERFDVTDDVANLVKEHGIDFKKREEQKA
jgi:hypothetical protein